MCVVELAALHTAPIETWRHQEVRSDFDPNAVL